MCFPHLSSQYCESLLIVMKNTGSHLSMGQHKKWSNNLCVFARMSYKNVVTVSSHVKKFCGELSAKFSQRVGTNLV